MLGRIRYAVFFGLLALALSRLAQSGGWAALAWWPAASCVALALAYGLGAPRLICGKREDGRVSATLLLLNLPWLALTWSVWLLTSLVSREPAVHAIPGTSLCISRYPLWGVDLAGFDVIFDLTAEFPRLYAP